MSASRAFTVAGQLLLGGELVPGTLMVDGGHIVGIRRGETAPGGASVQAEIIAPGYIDLQVNGGYGVEVTDGAEALRTLARRLPETGVTRFLPTVVSSPDDCYRDLALSIEAVGNAAGARPLGLHLEGPLLSSQRAGAHAADVIMAPSGPLLQRLLASGVVRMMTLAPEHSDAATQIRELRAQDITVSLGHTDASYDEFIAGVDAGATMATHLFNAMAPFHHRAPGAVGAALVDPRVTVGLIADGIHSHPASLRLTVAAKGTGGIALVTDMMSAAGMPPGRYALAGQHVNSDGASARLADGTLAGAIVTMDQAVRRMVRWAGLTPAAAIRMASETPARVLGLRDAGTIVEGGAADLVLLDRTLHVRATIIGGRLAYAAPGCVAEEVAAG